MARRPPTEVPPAQAGAPPAAEVEAAIQRALDALRPRAPAGRAKARPPAKSPPSAKPRPPGKPKPPVKPRPDNDA